MKKTKIFSTILIAILLSAFLTSTVSAHKLTTWHNYYSLSNVPTYKFSIGTNAQVAQHYNGNNVLYHIDSNMPAAIASEIDDAFVLWDGIITGTNTSLSNAYVNFVYETDNSNSYAVTSLLPATVFTYHIQNNSSSSCNAIIYYKYTALMTYTRLTKILMQPFQFTAFPEMSPVVQHLLHETTKTLYE